MPVREIGMARRTKAGTKARAPEQQFLRLMSHEMRNPLNGVLGPLALLGQSEMPDRQRRLVGPAAREVAERDRHHVYCPAETERHELAERHQMHLAIARLG